MARSPGESLYSGKTPAERAVEKIADDFKELQEKIVRREEWMCAQAIFTGKIPIVGEGINEEIDFNFTNFVDYSADNNKSGRRQHQRSLLILKRGGKQFSKTALSIAIIFALWQTTLLKNS